MCHGNHRITDRNQIFHTQVKLIITNLGSPVISVFIRDQHNFLADHTEKLLLVRQDAFQVINPCHQIFILFLNLVAFQTGQCTQTHINNGLCLYIIQCKLLNQGSFCNLNRLGTADNLDHTVNVIQRNEQTL